jgi:serine/threonine protein kinase
MPGLVVDRGNEKGVCLTLDGKRTVVVGRLKTCDLVLTDGLVSRRHFEVEMRDGDYYVRDLESHNGTHVNGERISKEVKLAYGMTIRTGETLFIFREQTVAGEGALAGKRLGGYHLLTRIGVGGMGEVYRAQQESLGRVVALKILSPELTSDRSFVEKFVKEARAAGKLNHPNVVHVHEVTEENGLYFFSMELIEGGSVQDLVSKGRRLDAKHAADIILQAARALEFAEKAGIVHCDIKPDNLMLTANGDVRLADLGIAKTLNEKGMAEQSDGVFGSPHFMAPEQARGLPMDHRSDLYSLGVTFYRILLGKVPFGGKDAREIMEKQVFEEPPSPRKIDPNLPAMIYTVLAKLLKKKPAERYQTASALIKDLELVLKQLNGSVRTNTITQKITSGRFKKRTSGSGFW